MKDIQHSKVAVLVVSCDRYADLWQPFFHCFWKYWPDCPYPVYLGTNEKKPSIPRVQTVAIGRDISYSDNLLAMVGRLSEEWVICWVEDRFISAPVNTKQVLRLVGRAQEKNAGYLKLIPEHPLAYVGGEAEIGDIPAGTTYRVSMTLALWRKNILSSILQTGESAWDLEKKGSNRSNAATAAFLGMVPRMRREPPIQHEHIVIKGRLIRTSISFLHKEGLYAELCHRQKESWRSFLYSICYHAAFRIVRPWQSWRRESKNTTAGS